MTLKTKQYALLYCEPHFQRDELVLDLEETRPLISVAELCCLDIAEVCAPNAILFLHLPARRAIDGIDIMKAWSFKYKTCLAWPRVAPNDACVNGYKISEVQELLYIATRGSNPPMFSEEGWSELQETQERSGSFRQMVQKFLSHHYSSVPRAEILPRAPQSGWDSLFVNTKDTPRTNERSSS